MTLPLDASLSNDVYHRAANARDARFDGVFFIGITTTHIYCRPVCPARVSYPERRRFFASPAAAERDGYRPCLRCRPELAPGHAMIDAVSRLARSAAHRIEAGALNGRSVSELARDLGVSERHLRRALERELGVSPIDLAQTHRLLLAKRLLADTQLPVTRVAYVSGFQSLRRFNALFRERYRLPPSAVRRRVMERRGERDDAGLSLTLAYRAPFDWNATLQRIQRDLIPGVEAIDDGRYSRTVALAQARGVIHVEDEGKHLRVEVSPSLIPQLMPLLARVRRLFDLDAEPTIIDRHLADAGLEAEVAHRPGIRIPGGMDGFEVVMAVLLRGRSTSRAVMRRFVEQLGDPLPGESALSWIMPDAARVAGTGAGELALAGLSAGQSRATLAIARAICERRLLLEPGSDPHAAHRALLEIDGIDDRLAQMIVMQALAWPDAFPATDRALQRAAGVTSSAALLELAEKWRPWRAYAALHLWR